MYGGWWQFASKTDQAQITIDGEPVVELDHAQLHPRLLYARSGQRLDGDAYDLPGWGRRDVKVGFNVLINASSFPEAAGAIANELKGKDREGQAIQLIAALKKRHAGIARSFHSGAGLRLQAIDADMAEEVMTRLLKRNVVALPIHDSFLVQEGHEGILREARDTSYERAIRNP